MPLSQLAIPLGVQVDFLSGSSRNRHEDCLNMNYCSNYSDLCITSFSFSLQVFRKRSILVLSDSSQKNGRVSGSRWQSCIAQSSLSPHRHTKRMGEIGNFSKKFVARYGWTLEKFRIQPSLQINNNTSRKLEIPREHFTRRWAR